ncbi:hypothetical protein AA0472_0297 [Acetobacter estunensis NRIC 0472]|uniref:Uncharacterized protein n=1 Tax=Acetobacter estunensis TaxID=104097 RepID=A0A967B4I3_9PROT|nr:hypothetical protein [Acetobacter estunensis]NHO53607.1 hypothetical protein [Acetobacter estunensis]GBQ20951.1 hypothetical protein AA0472_0297 [Acetobacter estunensis NRIC 0472]
MADPLFPAGDHEAGSTIHVFPGRHVLGRAEAARYLGITPRRLFLMELARCGPVALERGRYRTDALDVYRVELFLSAGLPASEGERRNGLAASLSPAAPAPHDPFMDMATQHDLLEVGTFIGARVAIAVGLIVIVLSHTPLSRVLFHVIR